MAIRLLTLGCARCVATDRDRDLPINGETFALLVYLAMERSVTRRSAARLLVPGGDDGDADLALARTVAELDRALGVSWLASTADALQITDQVSIDAAEFEHLVRAGNRPEALGLYHGEFLAGFVPGDSPEFSTWMETRRRELKHLFHYAAREHTAVLVDAGDWDAAIEHASRWVEVQPLDDEANHALVEALIASGERADALAHFDAYQVRIHDQLNMRPLAKTVALVERLHASESGEASRKTASGMGQRRSLLGELTRRRVLRMAGWYAASLFVVLESVQAFQEALYLPPWLLTGTALIGLFGFPVALLLSWQFDLTPEGILRTDWTKASGRRALSRGDWRVVSIAMLMILASTVAAFSTSTVRSLLEVDRTPPLLCEDGSMAPCRNAVAIEPNRFAVLPLAHQEGAEPGLLDGEICARLLVEGLSHWHDINIADPLRLNEALRRLPQQIRRQIPVDSGLAIARAVGAGKLIMGELWHYGDTTRVRAQLYDVTTGELVESSQTQFLSADNAGTEFLSLAQSLLLASEELSVSSPVAVATTSRAAVIAYASAWKAIGRWDLARSRRHFEAALQLDPDYPYAHLWLAHVMLWQSDTTAPFTHHAERAAAAAGLGAREQLLAQGIHALAARRFGDACEVYRGLLARDAASFDAWYGLSECLARDKSVRRDDASPSGWSFNSSYEEAISAHRRALQLVPSFNEAFVSLGSSRLATLLFLSPAKYRSGIAQDSPALHFAARPELVGDTIRFVPYPHAEWVRQPVPSTNAALIDRHRVILRQVATTWAGAFPDNTRALEALAAALEQTGEIERGAATPNTALDVVRRARLLETDRERKSRLAAAEVRFLFKVGKFKDARALALATLKDDAPLDADDARRRAGLAGLVGRPHAMAQLLVESARDFDYDRPASGEAVEVPHELAAATAALLGYAYVGWPVDSLRVLAGRAHAILGRTTVPEQWSVMHAATLDRAARVLFPLLGPDDVHRSNASLPAFLNMQRLIWRGNPSAVSEALAEFARLQRALRPTDAAADGVLTQAQLHLAVRDTARAVGLLDSYLNDLQGIPPSHFRQPYQPVSIVRLMQLRAELAWRAGDRRLARKWARAVVDLWRNGDREIRPVLNRMRTLARAR